MEEFKIKAGSHYCKLHYNPIIAPNGIEFTFRFSDRSMYYSKKGTYLRGAVNKLCGLSFDPIGRNSARLGWRYNYDTDFFEVIAYFHINGKFYYNEKNLVNIKRGEAWTCHIKRTKISGKDQIGITLRSQLGNFELLDYIPTPFKYSILGYKQLPYFGGSETLIHDIYLELGVDKIS